MKLVLNNNILENYTIVLSTRSKRHLGQISPRHIKDMTFKGVFASCNEGSFTVVQEVNDENGAHVERLWDDIVDLKLVWVKELDEYFEIKVSLCESTIPQKIITATSLCEAELSQTNLYNLEINSEIDIEREDYVITKFYNPDNLQGSLLHRVLEKAPHYSIKYVAPSLWDLQRTFSVDGTSVYDFFTGECAEQINCLFTFDTKDRSISVYDLYTVCKDCGYRGEYNDICPKCGNTDLEYLGEDTTILVSKENLTDEIRYETDVDSIKNCFRLVAGDDDMTAAIINCMPNGSPYLYYISEQQKKDMSSELVEKLELYDELYDSYTDDYQTIMNSIYDCIDEILYYQSEMMPDIELPQVTASTEAAKLTENNLSPTAISSLSSSTNKATVESALKNIARIFVNTGCVKLEINESVYTYSGTSETGINYGTWTGNFKITNYSNEEDIAYSPLVTVIINNDYETFLDQKVRKNISTGDEDGNVYDVLAITDLEKFKEALTFYCYNRLESFADAIQGALNVLIEECQGYENADYYNTMYLPYYNKLVACQTEMNIRAQTIKELETEYDELISRRNEIQKALDFESYLGRELYLEFCLYRREDTYQNDNYISDGLDNTQILQNALAFIEEAKKEIVKSGEHQHNISADLKNLLAMDEFAPIVDHFELGNWIRFKIGDDIYRLRLVSYEFNFGDIQTLDTEFSTLTKTANGVNDVNSILKSAQSMSTSYSSVSKQAEKGNNASNTVKDWVNEGLNSALVEIKNNDAEEVTYGKQGVLCREFDDITGDYSPQQLRLTHNILAFTKNNWLTAETALGLQIYKYFDSNGELLTGRDYGLNTNFVQSAQINGSQMIGGEIFSENYSLTNGIGTYINLNEGTMSFGGGVFTLDATGKLTSTSGTIGGANISNNALSSENGNWSINSDGTATFKDVVITGKNSSGSFGGGFSADTGFDVTGGALTNFNDLVANKVTADYIDATVQLTAKLAVIDEAIIDTVEITNSLKAEDASIRGTLSATQGRVGTLEADNVTINGRLDVAESNIGTLNTDYTTVNKKLTAAIADITSLETDTANIKNTLTLNGSTAGWTYKTIVTNVTTTNYSLMGSDGLTVGVTGVGKVETAGIWYLGT